MAYRRSPFRFGPLFGPRSRHTRSSRPRYPRARSISLIWLLIVIVLLLYRGGIRTNPQGDKTGNLLPEGAYVVERVVDGDTLRLTNGETVRLIGVDTPETVKPNAPVEQFGHEATNFTKDFLQRSSFQVRLTFDSDRRDKYGRLLAYVWVGDQLLNEELVLAGLARVETQYSYSRAMKERFLRAEDQAKIQRRGIWALSESGL